jgi:hypothetical protein
VKVKEFNRIISQLLESVKLKRGNKEFCHKADKSNPGKQKPGREIQATQRLKRITFQL